MSALLALLVWFGVWAHTPADHAALPACSDRTDVISVWRDDPVPCDVQASQRLDIYGISLNECELDGGEYIVTSGPVPGEHGDVPDPDVPLATAICSDVDD